MGGMQGAGMMMSFFGSFLQDRALRSYRRRLQQAAQFNAPETSLTTDFGNFGFGENAAMSLAPRLRQTQSGLENIQNQAINELQTFNPQEAALQRFGMMEDILAPQRDRAMGQTAESLFGKGMLSSSIGTQGMVSARQGIEQQRLQDLLASFGESRAQQEHLMAMSGAAGTQARSFDDMMMRMFGMGSEYNQSLMGNQAMLRKAMMDNWTRAGVQRSPMGEWAQSAGSSMSGGGIF